ncbi:hypothetical protein V2J09_020517 [Rumex salicifolius]
MSFIGPFPASYYLSKSMRWWEKTVTPNMIEIKSANELVDTLKNSGDRLVIIDFYSPACGGCKALHPKLKKFKEALAKHNTEVQTSLVGPSKGLDESELIELASIGEISTNPERQIPLCIGEQEEMNNLMLRTIQNPTLVNITQELFEAKGDNSMLVA